METTTLQTNLTVLEPSQDKQEVPESTKNGDSSSFSCPRTGRRTSPRFLRDASSNDPLTCPEALATMETNLRNKASGSVKEPSDKEGDTCCVLKDATNLRTDPNDPKSTTQVGTNFPPPCGLASTKTPPMIAKSTVTRGPLASNRRHNTVSLRREGNQQTQIDGRHRLPSHADTPRARRQLQHGFYESEQWLLNKDHSRTIGLVSALRPT
jgi:hypothetical protein